MIHALVIDDDVIARAYLCHLLHAHGGVAVVGEAGSAAESRELFARAPCDLLFLNVALGGGDGFALMDDVPAGTRVVFTSTHGDGALQAFEVNALDYLVKPINPARLAKSLGRHFPVVSPAGLSCDDVVPLRDGGHSRLTRIGDICVIEAEENYSRVHLRDGTCVMVRRPLKGWAALLPAVQFLRVHRTGIINLTQVKSYTREPHGGISLEVPPLTSRVPVGRTRWAELRALLPRDLHSTPPMPIADPAPPTPFAADEPGPTAAFGTG